MRSEATPITRLKLLFSLAAHGAKVPHNASDDELAEAIERVGSTAICGKHDSKPVSYARAFEILTGRRLTLKRAG
jgi:hypothetical protein